MNVKAIWLPLALLASILTSTADAQGPASTIPAATTGAPDLCAELDIYGDPARCEAVGPGMARVWDSEVCCDDDTCTVPSSSGCATGTEEYWCEHAELYADGSLACLYEVPAFCDVFPCGPVDLAAPPLKHEICCYEVGCYDHGGGLCGGTEVWCGSGVTNDDGTVTCLDGEE